MNEQHDGTTLKYEYPNLDDIKKLYIDAGAYQIKPPPPVLGYWVLPPHDTPYKSKFAVYCSKPNWFHRTALRIVLGIKWEDNK